MNEIKWEPKHEWWAHGKDFLVQVKHHTRAEDDRFANLWNVYVFIYPKHPHFANFEGENMWQAACTNLPLHTGPSYHRIHYNEKQEITSHQIGCDYDHLHDDDYRRCEPKDQFPNGQVFDDAKALFEWMTERAQP